MQAISDNSGLFHLSSLLHTIKYFTTQRELREPSASSPWGGMPKMEVTQRGAGFRLTADHRPARLRHSLRYRKSRKSFSVCWRDLIAFTALGLLAAALDSPMPSFKRSPMSPGRPHRGFAM